VSAFVHRQQDVVGLNSRFDDLAFVKVFLCMIERSNNHVFNLSVGQAVGWLHFDLCFLAAALLARADVQYAIGVDQEFHFNARQSCRHGWNAFQIKAR
jgi:hypothetical protein